MRRFMGLSFAAVCCVGVGVSSALAQDGSSLRELAGAGVTAEDIYRGIGADLCGNAQQIEGAGTFDFDNSNAGTDGLEHPACLAFSQDNIFRDVWYRWTSHCTGAVTLETCEMTSVDTKVAVYAPGAPCPPTDEFLILCDDDSCDVRRNSVTFFAVAGQSYLIRLGNYAGGEGPGNGGTGTFTISCDGEFELCTDAVACQDPDPSNARRSDNSAFRTADDITIVTPGDIVGLCFRGTYDGGGSQDIDNFVVTYYEDDGGIPGLPIARFRQGSDLALEGRRDTGELIAGFAPAWEYVVCHAPVPVARNQDIWVEIMNDNIPAGGMTWYWQFSQGGNLNSLADGSVNDSYANATQYANDQAFCLRLRTCPTDINKDGTTGFGDLNAILVNFGFDCD